MKKNLDSISVAVSPPRQNTGSPANLLAILHEIETMLEALIATGETSEIDLRHAPLSTGDLTLLKGTLGAGEISAQLDALGTTRFRETSVSGVWWVTHYNQDEKVLAESIEVTPCPEMLTTSCQDLRSGLGLLKSRLSRQSLDSDPGRINERLEAMGFQALSPDQDHPNLNESVKRSHGNAK